MAEKRPLVEHMREECRHGIVRRQCKCPSPTKTVAIVACPPRCAEEES